MYKDILLIDPTGDLKITNGDFNIGASDQQHTYDIINDMPGEWKQYPNVGVGIDKYVKGVDMFRLHQNITLQLEADKFTVNDLNITWSNEILNIVPDLER